MFRTKLKGLLAIVAAAAAAVCLQPRRLAAAVRQRARPREHAPEHRIPDAGGRCAAKEGARATVPRHRDGVAHDRAVLVGQVSTALSDNNSNKVQ